MGQQSVVLKGAEIRIYIAGKIYPEAQEVRYVIDYGEREIYGIDTQYAQEIAPTRVSVQGSVSGVKVKVSGGLQGKSIRTRIHEILYAPYTSFRIQDKFSAEDILFLPQMKVTSESFSAQIKGVVRVSFNFKGIIPYQPIDLDGSNRN